MYNATRVTKALSKDRHSETIIVMCTIFLTVKSVLLSLFIFYDISGTDADLMKIFREINTAYDSTHPLPLNYTIEQQLKPHIFLKRCIYIQPANAFKSYYADHWKSLSHGQPILVNSPCLGSDSMGNYLGSYFESISCSYLSGLHYVAVAKVYEPLSKHASSAFISHLPDFVKHNSTVAPSKARKSIMTNCRCDCSCHEHPGAAWTKSLHIIRPMFFEALLFHLNDPSTPRETTVNGTDISSEAVGSVLPLIPDAAVHYRCGDNFVGDYGFLPFRAIKDKIPLSSRTIYVLAETRNRKTVEKQHLSSKCDAILYSLWKHLCHHFPKAKVVVKRGDDIYIDMARLTFAKTTICSVSTFCLWPAIASNGTAYFPRTNLILRGTVSASLGFKWILSPSVVLGALYTKYKNAHYLIEKLSASS